MNDNIYSIFHQANDPLTPFAISYEIKVLHEQMLEDDDVVSLTTLILDMEGDIIRENPQYKNDGGTGLGGHSLTAKSLAYNMLEWDNEVCQKIKGKLRDGIDRMCPDLQENIYARMWANVLRRGQSIRPHQHACDEYSFLSANIILQANGTQTVYQNPYGLDNLAFDNTPGYVTIYPEYVIHWTTVHNQPLTPRVSLGVDIVVESALDQNRSYSLVQL